MNFRSLLEPHADAANALPMAAYMKHHFRFLGIPAPQRRNFTRPAWLAAKSWDAKELRTVAELLWAEPEREFHYLAIDILDAGHKQLSAADLPWIEQLCRTNQWWDSIDALSSPVLNDLALRDEAAGAEIEKWGEDGDFWLRRAAIIHQRRSKAQTNEARLYRLCLLNAADKEFFIRKGIGWALREYGKTAPASVKSFMEAHSSAFSSLTVREVNRYIKTVV